MSDDDSDVVSADYAVPPIAYPLTAEKPRLIPSTNSVSAYHIERVDHPEGNMSPEPPNLLEIAIFDLIRSISSKPAGGARKSGYGAGDANLSFSKHYWSLRLKFAKEFESGSQLSFQKVDGMAYDGTSNLSRFLQLSKLTTVLLFFNFFIVILRHFLF